VAPGLIYPVPEGGILSLVIKSLRDYYPLYQLIYQTFVFISRSSLSLFHLPPLPMTLLPVPSLVQLGLLATTLLESATGFISSSLGDTATTWLVLGLISLEGLCGGSAYVNAYYHLGQQMDDEDQDGRRLGHAKDSQRVAQEREFRIASVGVFDTLGILLAAGAASVLEPRLCRAQQDRGKTLCIGL
jgi:battenin